VAEPADPTAQIHTENIQTSSDHIADTAHSTDESSNAATIRDAVATAKSGADPVDDAVDDAVDESRDGIYVSRETVRTHPSDRQVEPGDSGAAVDGLNAEADVARDESISPAGVDNSPSGVPGATTAESTDIAAAHADPIEDDAEADTDPVDGDDLVPVPGTTFGEIDLDLIRPNPRQPRDVFDEDALDELITSIREIGVLQPVVVRRRPDLPGHYELIMGERRYRASKEAGRTTIPAIVRATADDDLLRDALLENLHRVDLNPLEEAAAYAQLLEDFNCTQEELSDRIGRSRPQISNTIRLLKLPAMVQRRVAAGVLSSGHARALLGLNDGADMEQLAQRVVAEGLSVRATEEAVILLNRGDRLTVSRGTRQADPELAELARNLGDRLDTRVTVVMGKRKGKLSVEFANGEDLARILTLLGLDSSDV
jgi:ParB family chromosome partitioning protein